MNELSKEYSPQLYDLPADKEKHRKTVFTEPSKFLISSNDSVINGCILLHFGVIYSAKLSGTDLSIWKYTIVVIKSKTIYGCATLSGPNLV